MSTSSMTQIHSTFVVTTPSSVGTFLPKHDVRNTIIGAVLGVSGLILGVVLLMLRRRSRQRSGREGQDGSFGDTKYPAANIEPFGIPGTEGHSCYDFHRISSNSELSRSHTRTNSHTTT